MTKTAIKTMSIVSLVDTVMMGAERDNNALDELDRKEICSKKSVGLMGATGRNSSS